MTTAQIKADVTYLVEQWNHIYDVDFTKETFEAPLRSNQVQMMVLIHQIDDIRAKIGEFKKKDPTVPKEFHFHELNIRGEPPSHKDHKKIVQILKFEKLFL